VDVNGSKVVVVNNSLNGHSYEVTKIDGDAIPIWCNVQEHHKAMFRSFNSVFVPGESFHSPVYTLCYSGPKPDLNNVDLQDYSAVFAGKYIANKYFVMEEYNPFIRGHIVGFAIESDYRKFFPLFFGIYKDFCMDPGMECCMTGDGGNFYLTMFMDDVSGLKRIYKILDEVPRRIRDDTENNDFIKPAFNLFSSIIVDQCSFNKWYYGSLFMDIQDPEVFMNVQGWYNNALLYKRNYIRRIGVQVIDSERADPGELNSLSDELSKLLD